MNRYFRSILVAFAILLSFCSYSQTKTFKLEDIFSNPKIYPSNLSQLNWMGNSDNYAYVTKNSIVSGNVVNKNKDTILRLNDLLVALDIKTLKGFPSLNWINKNTFTFFQENQLFLFDIPTKKAKVINKTAENAENIDLEKNTFRIAYTKENNLYIADNNTIIPVTAEPDKGIVCGQSVHRNEFGIEKGTFWSPKGNFLAFYRMDQTMVTDYPLVDIDSRIASLNNVKYPMAGMTSHQVTVGIFDPVTKKTVFLKTGEPKDQYLTNISWSPDEKFIFIAVLNRAQNHMKLNQYDAATGEFIKTLFEEKNDRYVEPLNGMYFLNSNPSQFTWMSQRDGYTHLYLYDISGKLLKQLTKGNWVVTELLGFDENCSKVFYVSTQESPLERHVYSLDIKSCSITKLTKISGTHDPDLSLNGKFILDRFSSTKVSREIDLIDNKGKTLEVLLENKNPLIDYKLGSTSIFTIKGDDNSDLYCRMIKPVDFDSTKKYPVIVYVYGGPHAQLITNSWLGGAGMFLNYLATKGYLVFTLDNRGSANRGFEFESCIHRNLGSLEIADQMKGISYLKKQKYVDTTRMGVDGWSYGGFLSISLMLKYPGVFKVATAGGPVIDWKYYEVMYGERYMDTPEENPKGYDNACLLNYAKNLQGKLLIIHGTVDATVVWQNSLAFIKKCVDEGKQVDYFVYPGHEHNVGGSDRLHLFKKIETYFNDYL
jgi:dipeptidyl-peptidase-4